MERLTGHRGCTRRAAAHGQRGSAWVWRLVLVVVLTALVVAVFGGGDAPDTAAPAAPVVVSAPVAEPAVVEPELAVPSNPGVVLPTELRPSAAAHVGALPVEPAGLARLPLPATDGPLWRETAAGLVDARGRPVPSLVVRGRLLDDAGTPVAGAELALLPDGDALALLDAWPGWVGPQGLADARSGAVPAQLFARLPRAFSAADGRFAVALPSLPGLGEAVSLAPDLRQPRRRGSPVARSIVPTSDLSPGAAEPALFVEAPGFVPEARVLTEFAQNGGALGDVVLARGVTASGRLLDEDGAPVAGATVRLDPEELPRGQPTVVGHGEVLSGADGRFVLPARWAYGSALLRVSAPGFRVSHARVGGDTVLQRAWTVAGRVVDEDGRLLPDVQVLGAPVGELAVLHDSHVRFARVTGADRAPLEWNVALQRGVHVTRTDAAGRFVLDRLPDQLKQRRGPLGPELDVLAWAPGRALTALRCVPTPSADGTTRALDGLELVLPRAAELELVVTDEQGRPLPGARLDVRRWSGEDDALAACPVVAAGQPGRFVARHVGPLGQYVEALAPGCAPRGWWVDGVEPGQRGRVELSLAVGSGARLDLVVVDDRGWPLPDVAVSAVQEGAWSRGCARQVGRGRTAADGRLGLDGLAPERAFLDLVLAGHARRRLETRPGDGPLTVTVPRLATLTVRLVDAAGAPLPDARVRLQPLVLEPSDELPPDRPVLAQDRTLDTDVTGAAHVPDIEAGLWRVRLPDGRTTVDVPPGEHLEVTLTADGEPWPG